MKNNNVHKTYTSHIQPVHATYTKRIQDPYTSRIHRYRGDFNGSTKEYEWLSFGRRVLYTGASFAAALLTTMYADAAGEDAIVTTWIIFLSCMVVCDPVNLLSRWIAKPSRGLIGFSLVMCLAAWYVERMIIPAFIICIMSGVLIFFKNWAWTEAEAWKMTATVERAMKTTPADSVTGAWLKHRPEIRTMLHEAGHSMTDKELDSFISQSWSLGYLHGNSTDQSMKKMQSQIKAMQNENTNLKEQLLQRVNPDQRLIEENAALEEALTTNVELIKRYEEYIKQLEDDARASAQRLEALENASTNVTEATEGREETTATIIPLQYSSLYKRIIESDMSISKTAESLGCKRWQVQHTRDAVKMFEHGASIEDVKESTRLSLDALKEIQELIA